MGRMHSRFVSFTALGWALGALSPVAAAAQDAAEQDPEDAEEAPDGSQGGGLEAIIVTAERREVNLQDSPTAATALTGEQLTDKAVERIDDLQFAMPSLSITDAGLTQSVNIRGIGLASGSPAVTNGVATYYDNIFQPPILTTGLFYDIATVEVLRGPQGTFVGSNSTGGAVFINTVSPSLDRVKGYARGTLGNYDMFGVEGAVNVPVSSILAVRAAGKFLRRDSFFEDLGPFDNEPDSLKEKAGRLGILLQPGSFRAVAKLEWVDRNTGGFAQRPTLSSPYAYDRRPDIRLLTYNTPTKVHERGFQASLEMRYELDGGIVLRSVSGYVNKRMNNLYDTDAAMTQLPGGPSVYGTMDQFVREREYVQEINIISPTDGAFNWIAGAYYQKNTIDIDIDIYGDAVNQPPNDPVLIDTVTNKTTAGVFGQVGYKIVPELEIQLGARYSHFKGGQVGGLTVGRAIPGLEFLPFPIPVDLTNSHTDSRVTGKVGLSWTLDEDNLVYAFVARGYKPGGANGVNSEFGPETIWDYEAGWKSAFFDDHLRTQASAFYMQYNDFQFETVDPTTGQNGVTNIANASIKGLELQAQMRFGGLQFDGGIAYVDSQLDQVNIVNNRLLPPGGNLGPQCAPGQVPPGCFDYGPYIGPAGGGPNLYSAKWSYNFGIEYDADIGPATITPRVNYGYIGPRWTNLFYDPAIDLLRARGLWSALLTVRVGDWAVEAFVNNLTDKEYISGSAGNAEFYGAPREYGVRTSVRF